RTEEKLPPVHIALPDGTVVHSGQHDLHKILSNALKRDVELQPASPDLRKSTAEEYWLDMEGFDYRDAVTDFVMPEGTFFDGAFVHLLTTATIDRLRMIYPEGRFEVRRFRPNIVVQVPDSVKGCVAGRWVGRALARGWC